MKFYTAEGREDRINDLILDALDQNPNDRYARFALVGGNINEYSTAMSVGFAESFEKRNPKISLAEQKTIYAVKELANNPDVGQFLTVTRPLAEAIFSELDGDLRKSEENLKKIKMPVKNKSTTQTVEDYEYISDTLNELKKRTVYKIYFAYEDKNDRVSANRIYQEFLKK
ncbi:MAG: hypothetical protein A2Z20_02310 [Bdellovibrionales bacterium RBG_16_40_8]|nr:MAG: hypothetical protein A2Z20_02310 [Bdellovibrionales bacterium RBG_16_40_8]